MWHVRVLYKRRLKYCINIQCIKYTFFLFSKGSKTFPVSTKERFENHFYVIYYSMLFFICFLKECKNIAFFAKKNKLMHQVAPACNYSLWINDISFLLNFKIRRLDNEPWRKLRLLYFWHTCIMIRLQYRKRNYRFRNWRLVANGNAKVSGIWKIKRIYVTQIFKVRPVVRHADKICHNWTNELGCYKIPKTHVVCYCEQSQRRKKLILSPFKKSFISQTQ